MLPAVSVLLPVRDAAPTLPVAIRSVLRQSERDLECVVVDDGSRDGSLDVAHAAAAADPRVRVLARPRAGLIAALVAGVAACRGGLVARMDADDVMRRHRLRWQVAALRADPGLAAVGGHVRCFPRAGLRDGRLAYERWLNAIADEAAIEREEFVECPLAHPTLVVRREVLAEFGYRDRGWPEDYDLLLRLRAAGRRVGVVPRRVLAWRDLPQRCSRTDPRYDEESFARCKAQFLADGPLRGGAEYVLWGHGGTGRRLRRLLRAHGKRAAFVIELHPGRLGQRIDGAPVVRPEALPDLPRLPIVVSVAGLAARTLIRAQLATMGFLEVRDFVVAA
jgi:cellulose synthase/poly-beta-1,6-N-acetylglucosamine synthase-like glycosyltransferase